MRQAVEVAKVLQNQPLYPVSVLSEPRVMHKVAEEVGTQLFEQLSLF